MDRLILKTTGMRHKGYQAALSIYLNGKGIL
jgi:hypothetical protein